MNTSVKSAPQSSSQSLEARLELILDSIQDIKGKNIVRIDLRQLEERPTEFFFICEGDSTTQVASIAGNVQKRMKTEGGELPKTATGGRHANWICLDYFDIVVHVFYPETRKFYELEDLWSDGIVTEYGEA
ncbi:MAG: ribosome silencing factor [Bacteroidota bacterium]